VGCHYKIIIIIITTQNSNCAVLNCSNNGISGSNPIWAVQACVVYPCSITGTKLGSFIQCVKDMCEGLLHD
jgi:hypothetical protein